MNIGEWISKRAIIAPDKPFLTEKNKTYNNRQFNKRVNKTAHALGHLDVIKGMRIALLMSNSSEFLEIFFACAKTGIIMVPLNFRLAVPELLYILRDSAPEILIYSSEFAAKVDEIKTACIAIQCYCHGDADGEGDPDFSEYVEGFEALEPLGIPGVDLPDPLFIMYTSGTTGDPKGAVLTHQNILFGAIHSLLGYGVDRSYKSLVVAPLFHIGALAASVTPIVYAGGSIMISSFYNASEILKTICHEKINYMFAVPVMYQMIDGSAGMERGGFVPRAFFYFRRRADTLAGNQKISGRKGCGFCPGLCADRNRKTHLAGS